MSRRTAVKSAVRRKKGTLHPEFPLTLKVAGQLRPGRIQIPDLLVICQYVQSAINRQAEALKGSQRTLRPGPASDAVRVECTLELTGIWAGSPTAALGFDFAKAQQSLPGMPTFGLEVLSTIGASIESLVAGDDVEIDTGVLDSLNNLGEVFERKKVKSIRWVIPGGRGQRSADVVFDKTVRRRVAQRLTPPTRKPSEIEGTIAMVDFDAEHRRFRIHPVFGPPIPCSFPPELDDAVYEALRKPARVSGEFTINATTHKVESVCVTSIKPLQPLAMGAGHFFAHYSFEQLTAMQDVSPLKHVSDLAGGWPDDEEPDQTLAEIYTERQ